MNRFDYVHSKLDGPNLNTVFYRLDSLEVHVHERFQNFVQCLKSFDLVKKACFGKDLSEDWLEKIRAFENSYRSLGISITPKAHCVFFEVPLFLEEVGMGLGHFATQKFESVHCNIKPMMGWYKRSENHPDFAEKLMGCIVNYNSEHVKNFAKVIKGKKKVKRLKK